MPSVSPLFKTGWWDALIKRYRILHPVTGDVVTGITSWVQPTVDIDRLVDRPRNLRRSLTIGADGTVAYFTPPRGKAWELLGCNALADSVATYNYRVIVLDGPVATGIQYQLTTNVAGNVYSGAVVPVPVLMWPGWVCGVEISGYAAGGTGLVLEAHVREFDCVDDRTPLLSGDA